MNVNRTTAWFGDSNAMRLGNGTGLFYSSQESY